VRRFARHRCTHPHPVIARPQAVAIQCGTLPDTAVRLVRAVCPSTAVLDCHVGFASSQ